MKKFVYFYYVLALCFMGSCENESEFIASESFISKEKSNIDLFEEKNGIAVKVERTFKDTRSGSYVKIVFASKSHSNLEEFFKNHFIEFDGLSSEEILESKATIASRINHTKLNISENNSKLNNVSNSFNEESVVFDLIEKKLLNDDKGFSFKIG